jgi:LPXTG-motif cell wall-anchored protein
LPETGSDTIPFAVAGGIMIAIGAIATYFSRRHNA